MKRILSFAFCLVLAGSAFLRAQEYPFQDTKLSEEERLDNAVSLMTVDEKIMTIVGQGVQRLGIAGPGATEAIHGIVRGGDAELRNLGNAGQFGNWPGRPQPKYRNSTAFPQAYGVGETWDREMAHIVGDVMSYEARFYSKDNPWNLLAGRGPDEALPREQQRGQSVQDGLPL